jgi:hypothetical protein
MPLVGNLGGGLGAPGAPGLLPTEPVGTGVGGLDGDPLRATSSWAASSSSADTLGMAPYKGELFRCSKPGTW